MATHERTSADFVEKVLKSDKYVLVDFWAPWCKPCLMMAPVLEAISEDADLAEKLEVSKVNTEIPANQGLAFALQISSIPNMKLFHEGKIVQEFIGFRPKEQLKMELLSAIK